MNDKDWVIERIAMIAECVDSIELLSMHMAMVEKHMASRNKDVAQLCEEEYELYLHQQRLYKLIKKLIHENGITEEDIYDYAERHREE